MRGRQRVVRVCVLSSQESVSILSILQFVNRQVTSQESLAGTGSSLCRVSSGPVPTGRCNSWCNCSGHCVECAIDAMLSGSWYRRSGAAGCL